MGIINLDKLPPYARAALAPFLEQLTSLYREELISVFAYGSVTGPDYNPHLSDINVGVVLKDVSLEKLRRVLPAVKKAMKSRVTAPLFLSPEYIKRSVDTFPIEFGSMRNTRLVLFGEDVLFGIDVKKEDLRRECEAQLKGRLVTVRQAYLEQAIERGGIERVIKAAVKSIVPVLGGILMMKPGVAVPASKEKIVELVATELKVDLSSLVAAIRDEKNDGKIAGKSAEQFLGEFLFQVEKLAEAVDKI